jgi:hypothetical protein
MAGEAVVEEAPQSGGIGVLLHSSDQCGLFSEGTAGDWVTAGISFHVEVPLMTEKRSPYYTA